MRVNRDDFVQKLKLLDAGRIKDVMQSPDYVIEQFILGKSYAAVQNEEICMIVPVNTGIKKGSIGFPEELLDVLVGMDSDKISIRINEKNSNAFIKGKNTKAQIKVKLDVKIRRPKVPNWTSLPKNFNEAVSICKSTSSTTGHYGFETCMNIEGKDIVSTDNVRVSQYKMSRKMKQMMIPTKYAAAIVKMEPTKYCIDDSQIYFTNDSDVVLAIRKMVTEFPPVDDIFEESGTSITLPENIGEAVKSALAFSKVEGEDVDSVISISMGPDGILCRSDNDRGWIESPMEVDLKLKKELEFNINPNLFLQIVEDAEHIYVSDTRILFITPDYKQAVALVAK